MRIKSPDSKSGAIRSVSWKFCLRFGREAQPKSLSHGKRAPLSLVKYFSSPRRTEDFVQHLQLQHAVKWKEYEAVNEEAKKEFFDLYGNESAHANTLHAYVDTGESLFSWVRRNILSRIIGDLLFYPSTCEEKVEAALSNFKEDSNAHGIARSSLITMSSHQQMELNVPIRKALAFFVVVDHVAAETVSFANFYGWGVFQTASQILRSIANRTGLLRLKRIHAKEVIEFVRAVVGADLQVLADFLNESECWAYSLAFDGAAIQGSSFRDVWVRLCVHGEIENVHLLAIPLPESHTGLQIGNVLEAVMVELCGHGWKGKFVGISTDGVRNVTGRHSGAVTSPAEGTLPGFFRV